MAHSIMQHTCKRAHGCESTIVGSEALLACKGCRYRHCSEKWGGPQTLLGAPATFFGSCRCSFLDSYVLQLLFQSTCMTLVSSKEQQQQQAGKDVRQPLCLNPPSQCMLHILQSRGTVDFSSYTCLQEHRTLHHSAVTMQLQPSTGSVNPTLSRQTCAEYHLSGKTKATVMFTSQQFLVLQDTLTSGRTHLDAVSLHFKGSTTRQ